MHCDHTRHVKVNSAVQDDDYDDGVSSRWEWERVSAMRDIDIGRMRCEICGEVKYYTGSWKDFWETGKPCLGSDKFDRERDNITVNSKDHRRHNHSD